MSNTALAGKTILVTRPAEQSSGLSRMIRDAGGIPFVFPAIEIREPSDPERLADILDRLEEFDLAIFVSPTAVARAFEYLDASEDWPKNLAVAAVGQGSAWALKVSGIKEVIAPTGQSDSEALLALPALQNVAGKRIVIFRGEGGRELMAQTLSQRGASVEYAECYRRARPDVDVVPLLQQQSRQAFSAMVLTSRESLANLHAMLGEAWRLFEAVPIFVPHERIAEAARQLGMHSVHVTSGGDADTMQAMIKFFQS
jgi:uroporphyrinogen-III synthase